MTIGPARLEAILNSFPKLTIGLVGDLFLDRYLEIARDVHELSLETNLEAYQVTQVRNAPGALGTVMSNLAALGVGMLRPVTVIGDDGHGYDLRKELARLPLDPAHLLVDSERLTPTYTKPLRLHKNGDWEELHRLDVRTRAPLSAATSRRVCQAIRDVFHGSHGVVVLDQVNEENWGVVNDEVRDFLKQLALEDPGKLVFVDSREHLGKFSFGVLKGNRKELLAAAGCRSDEVDKAPEAAQRLCRRTKRPVFCTVGERGILVARPEQANGKARAGNEDDHAPHREMAEHLAVLVAACPVTGPIDIVGAGDAATSGIVMSLLSGADELESAAVGNLVASITVQQIGTTGTATPAQIKARCREVQDALKAEH